MPPKRLPATDLTLHQRRVLDAWRSSGHVTLKQLAARFGVTTSAICQTLRIARAKVYGRASVPKGKPVRVTSLTFSFL